MVVTIILEKTTKELKKIIETLCQFTDIVDYEIKDSKADVIERFFPAVLLIGAVKFNPEKCNVLWELAKLPDSKMPSHEKDKIVDLFTEISSYLKKNRDPAVFKPKDLPVVDNLEVWLRKKSGVISIKLADNRFMGIYPDGEEFHNKHDIEIHYSTLVNVDKLFNLFKAKELTIKD